MTIDDTSPTLLPAVAALAAAGRRRQTTQKAMDKRWAHFCRFCETNGYQALPASETDVLRYVFAHAKERWGWKTARGTVDVIRAIHGDLGLCDPTRGRVALLLDAIRNEKGGSHDHIAPLRVEDATAIAHHNARMPASVPVLRAAVAAELARHFEASLRALAAIAPGDVGVLEDGIRIQIDARAVVLSKAAAPDLVANLTTLVPLVADAPSLLGAGSTTARAREELRRSLRRMARRAGLADAISWDPYPGAGLSEEDFAWWVAWADPSLAQRVRNTAYVLTSLACAYRHENARTLLITDVKKESNGYELSLRTNKAPSPNGSDTNLVPEMSDVPDCGEITCPACALGRWLAFRVRAGITDPYLFCRLKGEPGPVSAQNAWQQLKDMARAIGIDPSHLGTRSFRVGATSAMAMDGVPTPEIAEVTHHRSYSVLAGYVRNLDPVRHRYHLPL